MKLDPGHPLAARARPSGTGPRPPPLAPSPWGAKFIELETRWTLVLPIPPSNNDLVTPVRTMHKGKPTTKLVKTKVAKNWLALVRPILRVPGRRIEGPVQWWCTLYVNRISKDASNGVKQLEDALKGVCWNDDLQVVELHVKKRITEGPERVAIDVRPALDVDAETKSRILKSTAGKGPTK